MIYHCVCPPIHSSGIGQWHREPRGDFIMSLFEFEIWSTEQDLILYVWQLLLSYISIEAWIINPYAYGFVDGPDEVV